MWHYNQITGILKQNDQYEGVGYSGKEECKNNPDKEMVPFRGPIPRGLWYLGTPHDTMDHGPFVIPLTPDNETKLFGRSEFLMHGDSIEHPGCASEGCIIMSRVIRDNVASSLDDELMVE